MIEPDEFVKQWGDGPFVRANAIALDQVNLSEDSKQFLIKAGLPQRVMFEIVFDFSPDKLLTLDEALKPKHKLSAAFRRYRRLGHNQTADICIDELNGGCIVSVDNTDSIPPGFINSTIPQLAESFLILRDMSAGLTDDSTEEEFAESAKLLDKELRRIDPVALNYSENWWPQVVEARATNMA
jgi:hypothetical protein